jgi:hypothetical protein
MMNKVVDAHQVPRGREPQNLRSNGDACSKCKVEILDNGIGHDSFHSDKKLHGFVGSSLESKIGKGYLSHFIKAIAGDVLE